MKNQQPHKKGKRKRSHDGDPSMPERKEAPVDPAVETRNRSIASPPEHTAQEKNQEVNTGGQSGTESP